MNVEPHAAPRLKRPAYSDLFHYPSFSLMFVSRLSVCGILAFGFMLLTVHGPLYVLDDVS